MTQPDFYATLPFVTSFEDITKLKKYRPVPKSWHVIITDIKGSTEAIAQGKYKDVNTIGAFSIIAVLNAVGNLEIPFVFGGDGATMLVPSEVLEPAKSALLATKTLAKDMFEMQLRVGIVPVEDVLARNVELNIMKFRASQFYHQAMFNGNGVSQAEKMVKAEDSKYELKATNPNADYTGLECRWQDIYSPYGETVSIIVKATTDNNKHDSDVYKKILEAIHETYGTDEEFHPVAANQLRLMINARKSAEANVRAHGIIGRTLYRIKVQITCIVASLMMKSGIRIRDFNLALYKQLLIATTDYKKFDDVLRIIMAGTKAQREQLTLRLETMRSKGLLVYGIHVSDRALMTCLVFERYGKQVHFVDGADGGYAMAAKQMKMQMKKARHRPDLNRGIPCEKRD